LGYPRNKLYTEMAPSVRLLVFEKNENSYQISIPVNPETVEPHDRHHGPSSELLMVYRPGKSASLP